MQIFNTNKISSNQLRKIEGRKFVGPQIRELMKDKTFDFMLSEAEKRAGAAFIEVCHNFLENTKNDNYRQIMHVLL